MTCPGCLSLTEENDALAEKLQDARSDLALAFPCLADLHEAQREIEAKRRQISAAYESNTVLRARVKELERTVERQGRELAGKVWKRARIG